MTHPSSPLPPPRPWPGFFVVLEGIDGTGKTTLAGALAESLRAAGRDVLATFEPTRGPHGTALRALAAHGRDRVTPEEEMQLFIDDRREHLAGEILPALAAGKVVILDRYYYSTMAYQGARGVDPAWIETLHRPFAPEPDLLVLLDLPVAEALHRVTAKRGSVPDHFEGAEYLEKVRAIFLTIERPGLLRLDARQPTHALVARIREEISNLKFEI